MIRDTRHGRATMALTVSLALLVPSSAVHGAEDPDAGEAIVYAESVNQAMTSKVSAGEVPAMTIEAQRLVKWSDAQARIKSAEKYGDVLGVDEANCSRAVSVSSERCSGSYFLCKITERFASGIGISKVAVCKVAGDQWRLVALQISYPDQVFLPK